MLSVDAPDMEFSEAKNLGWVRQVNLNVNKEPEVKIKRRTAHWQYTYVYENVRGEFINLSYNLLFAFLLDYFQYDILCIIWIIWSFISIFVYQCNVKWFCRRAIVRSGRMFPIVLP